MLEKECVVRELLSLFPNHVNKNISFVEIGSSRAVQRDPVKAGSCIFLISAWR